MKFIKRGIVIHFIDQLKNCLEKFKPIKRLCDFLERELTWKSES